MRRVTRNLVKLMSLALVIVCLSAPYLRSEESPTSVLIQLNLEALASGERNVTLQCGYAAYEWDDDWYEDTKKFTICKKNCPEGSGTEPKYVWV